ncbi:MULTISPECIES: glycosyltransferase family 2 protein [Micromonospora]|uniref:Glycosyltransferase family 2 protein n=1 Tax=Micromonospora solifontis TaxID=2487138 RepID=A0ABX9WKM4_9ACTN|nr:MULTISPECIES: glycosyltransferase family 2 protein [Micromonospora]NES13155.1 glycosyltransferase family 2 protein [Micromonospora sp. PPF5-17B]NES36280.1 glycosyltransferase family 2 protein [Micromonospora solifontis]NES55080.1 glycosyltransferase family 2 protein [Micromonospora sp. PPF5-6]RNL99686.1 glycosyltransferase family 2 protein [Micromonospora solifontis]
MIVLVPVYRPGRQLLDLLDDLAGVGRGWQPVVVDDGSGPEAGEILDAARAHGAEVLRRRVNRGKGVVLKTGFRYVTATRPGRDVVCVDADGQHRAGDVVRVVDRMRETGALTLGVRRFSGDVPLRSRAGNALTRDVFRLATGVPVRDTQTGLRAYPAGLLDWLGSVPGERFEYEMNVLLHATRSGHPIAEAPIATRYQADNASSHFSALADSVRIYGPLLRFAAGRLLGQVHRAAAQHGSGA